MPWDGLNCKCTMGTYTFCKSVRPHLRLPLSPFTYLGQFQFSGIQLVIRSFLCDQILMIASFNDPPMLQHHDRITVPDGRKPVGDDKDCTPLHQVIHSLLDNALCPGVNTGCCLI